MIDPDHNNNFKL
jgi:hypothetical protein